MNDKLRKLRSKCTAKQAKFVELHKSGQERGEAYQNAYPKAKNLLRAQQEASRLLTKNVKVIAYFEALKANDDRNTNISRSMQLVKLNKAFILAEIQKNVAGMVSTIREQNEMLGFHRDTAPNLEREQARRDIIEKELKELERLAKARTAELSEPQTKPKIVKVG